MCRFLEVVYDTHPIFCGGVRVAERHAIAKPMPSFQILAPFLFAFNRAYETLEVPLQLVYGGDRPPTACNRAEVLHFSRIFVEARPL